MAFIWGQLSLKSLKIPVTIQPDWNTMSYLTDAEAIHIQVSKARSLSIL